MKLVETYKNLPLPRGNNSNAYTAESIQGYNNHRIAKNTDGNPSLLIFITEKNNDSVVISQDLFNLRVRHNAKCEIEIRNNVTHNNFSVISYVGQNQYIKELFIDTCEILIKTLGNTPLNKEVKNSVDQFIELFKSIKNPPRNTIMGLWSELLLIDQSEKPEYLIDAWHSVPQEKFDFSIGGFRLEVKSSGNEKRVHHFSLGQLSSSNSVEIVIASILSREMAGGLSIYDLLLSISEKLINYPKQNDRLILLTYQILGTDIEKVNQFRFDYEYAKDSLRFYWAIDVPKLERRNIPKEVSDIKFKTDLLNSKYFISEVDELLSGKNKTT